MTGCGKVRTSILVRDSLDCHSGPRWESAWPKQVRGPGGHFQVCPTWWLQGWEVAPGKVVVLGLQPEALGWHTTLAGIQNPQNPGKESICWPLRASTDHRFLGKLPVCTNHLLSLICSCWFCQAAVETAEGVQQFTVCKASSHPWHHWNTLAWYLLTATSYNWGIGGSEREVDLGLVARLKGRSESENIWSGSHSRQSCFIFLFF